MKAKLKTAPNQYPITLAEAKKQCEIDDFTDSVSTVNLGFRVVFEPNTPNG